MTKRFKLFLAILIGSIAVACFAAGCSIGQPGREEVLADYNGGHVTYYANGGCFNRNTSIVVRELYYKNADVPFFDVTEDTEGIDVSFSGYDFVGWHLPARYESGDHAGEIMYTYTYKNEAGVELTVPAYPNLKEDGTPVTDSTEDRPVFYIDGSDKEILEKDVQVKPSETVIDSNYMLRSDDDLIVCASWKPALKFVFKLAVEEDGDYVYNGDVYHKGDVISTLAFGKDPVKDPGKTISVAFDGMTFVSNYRDEQCTEFVGDYKREDYDGQAEIVVWSKFIKGSWTIVKNDPNKVLEMFQNLNKASNSYYLIEDVDCSSITDFGISKGVRATIEGNGHTLSNLKFAPNSFTVSNGSTIAPVFGAIYSTASICNLTLKNIDISVKGNGNMTFYAICSTVEDGAVLSGLTIDGVTATIKLPGSVSNAPDGKDDAWLFGGKGTDANFLAAYGGVKREGIKTLTITK
ncbi:MAG: hypothetical protein ACI4QN_04440 [Candidatus Coproplasma sp.]